MSRLFVFFLTAIAMIMTAQAIETPDYDVLDVIDDGIEIRHYDGLTLVSTTMSEGENNAFRRLAGYIFGNNEADEKISMTAPVLTREVDATQQEMLFYLPHHIGEPPTPRESNILFKEEALTVAVIRYKGSWRGKKYENNLGRLRQSLGAQDRWIPAGKPIWARYDPPFMPWFLRTNEIMIPVTRSENH